MFEGDVNQRNDRGQTLLIQAIQADDQDQVNLLLQHGADVNLVDQSGDSALVHAVQAGSLPVVTGLLQHQADVSIDVSSGGSLLVKALREKQLAATYLLLEHGARIHQAKGALGESLLQAATEMGNVSLLADLQKSGSHPSSDEGNGHGLLHIALDHKQELAFGHLLEQGLDPNRRNSKKQNLVHRSISAGMVNQLHLLKKNDADFDAPNEDGWRPLHMAILAGDDKMVRGLIQHGAQVHLFSTSQSKECTPLELAFDRHELGIARQLLEQNAPVRDELYQAVKQGGDQGLEIVRLLIEFDVSMDPDREGDSPLTRAVREDAFEIAKSLLEAGAPQDRIGFSGQKPFHLAVVKQDLPMVTLLIEHGADVNEPYQPSPSEEFLKFVKSKGVAKWALKKSPGLYPLMMAADAGNVPLAQLLMNNGASSGKSAKVGRHRFWPLTFAARRQDTDLQQVLFGQGPGKTKRWIRVDLSDQRMVLFEGEKAIFSSSISSGRRGNRTPTGKYVISNKYRTWTSTLYNSEMPYFQRLSGGDFGFHYGILPGYPASHGCIRLPMSKAKKLFRLTRGGDYVEIVK